MTNNPLNGYQPEYADAIADAQEHNIEHAKASQGGGSPDSPILPTCRFCGRQILPVDKYADAEAANIKRNSNGRKSAKRTSTNCAKPLTMYRLTLRKNAGSNTPTRFTIFYLIAALP